MSPAFDPCGAPAHPCTLAEVSPEVEARTDELVDQAAEHLGEDGMDVGAAAAWLAEQPDVVATATGDASLRFRVEGGRGTWLFTRLDATTGGPLLGGPTSLPPSSLAASDMRIDPAPEPAPLAGSTEQGKRALLLSPFEWQWQMGNYEVGTDALSDVIIRTRDYLTANGGTVDVRRDVLRTDPDGGDLSIDREIRLDDLRSWDTYDYVYMLTHGGHVCADVFTGPAPQGESSTVPCVTALMTSWTVDLLRATRQASTTAGPVLDALGTETGWISTDAREDLPSGHGLVSEPREDPTKALLGKFVMVTTPFFQDAYPGKLTDTVVFLNACSSAHQDDLVTALSGSGSAVFGWNQSVDVRAGAAAARAVTEALLARETAAGGTGGLRLEAALDTIADDVRSAMRVSRSGGAPSPLSVVNDVVVSAVTNASIEAHGDTDRRIREIAYLVDDEGTELGPVPVEVEGAPDDGDDDDLVLNVRVDGLDEETDPADIDLAVVVDGQRHDLDERLDRQVSPGVWQTTATVPLDRDHGAADVFDLEVVATLPEGRDSRWLYEDVPVGRVCAMSYEYDGTGSRSQYQGPIAGTASFATTEGATWQTGNMQLMNTGRSTKRSREVHVITLTDADPKYAMLVLATPEGGSGIPLGETGVFTFAAGAFLHGDEVDNVFEVEGTVEIEVTASEWRTFGEDDEPIPTVFVGTFRNVGPLVFDNPFPENGTAATVTELSGTFSFDASACQSHIL